ncbi:MAG TPA: DUF1501 domain-containing protein [Steroidobacteraceae bacterium]|nr:DUF1501 domain-containing protein [Steroidobacteraceae bacterium]
MTTRRELLRTGLHSVLWAATASALPRVTFAAVAPTSDARFVVILLRGALDGLTAVPPYGDLAYAAARGPIAIASPGANGGALDLNGFFGLHPALPGLHARYQAGELLVVHATATAYRERSHFDGQNVLENGGTFPSGAASGWLNRALAALPRAPSATVTPVGLAIGQNVPLILRGPVPVGSWAPARLPEVEPELITRLRDLYSNDSALAARLDEAVSVAALAGAEGNAPQAGPGMGQGAGANLNLARQMAGTAAQMLAAPQGPRVAVLDMTGWDTHAGEGAAEGQLASRLRGLDAVLDALREGLGSAWGRSAVLVCTEFGRTAMVNGTRGTDHGTGAAAFLVGGAVQGGRVLADWPGLAARDLYEGRDLRPTTDLRSIAKGVLREHLGLGRSTIEEVFPGSSSAPPVNGLIRA